MISCIVNFGDAEVRALLKVPSLLYQYKPWNKYTKDILKNHQLYFAPASQFNDPYDVNPYIPITPKKKSNSVYVFPQITSALETMEKLIEHLYIQQKKDLASCCVSCFSKTFDSVLMWSHYARFHKGVCLVFDTSMDEIFYEGQGVMYDDIRPTIKYGAFAYHYNPMFIKYKDWEYEKEFRIIRDPIDSKNKGFTVKFNPLALTEIIFGARTSLRTRNEVIKICSQNNLEHVKFSIMSLDEESTNYQLIKVPYKKS